MLDNALASIQGASVLPAVDIARLGELKAELRHTWTTVQIFRTRTEMEWSVLNDHDHPTPDAKFWQCQREQNAMFEQLVELSYAYRKNAIELRRLERKLAAESDDLEQESLRIDIERAQFAAANMERVAADRLREINAWHEIKAALLPKLKHGVDNVDLHQREAFPIRFAQAASLVTPHTAISDAKNIIGLHVTAQNRIAEARQIEGAK